MKRLVILMVSLLLAVPGSLWAQGATDKADASATTMQDMVVTATRTEQPLKDIPGRIEVISRAQLKQLPVETVDDALSYLPGVHVERTYGMTTHSATVSLRGMGNQQGRTLVLVDGVPQNTSDTGSVTWNRLNLEDVERIEVLKGPAGALYGDNSMGGVINIITVKPTKYFEGSTSASYGTDADWQLRGVAAGRTSEDKTGVYARVSAWSHTNRGYTEVPYQQQTMWSRKSFLDEKAINNKIGWDLTPTNNLEFQYTHDEQTIGEGKQIFAYLGQQRGYTTDDWQGKFTFGYEGWSGLVNVYLNDIHYDRVNESIGNTLASYSRTDSTVERTNYGFLTNISRVWGPNTFTAGVDYKDGIMDGNDYTRTAPWVFATDCGRLRNVGVFGQDQIRLFDEKLIFLGGLRYDNATTYDGYYATNGNRSPYFAKYNAQYEDHTWDDLSPRISAKYFFMPNLSAYASYGHAFRAPLLDDMYRTGYQMRSIKMSNPSLGPERSDSFEIGSDYQPVDNLKLSGSGYYSQVYDYMGTVTVGYDSTLRYNLMQVQNIGTVHIWGMELAAEYDPFKFMDIDLLKKMTLFANYTYNESRVVDSSERPDLNGKLVPYVPLHSFNVGYTWLNRFINNRVALQYIGTTYADETNTSYNKIDPHAIINAKLWRNFDFLGKYGENVTMSFTVENLLDSRYFTARNNSVSSPTSVNANETLNVGRTMYLEMSCKF